MDAFYSSPLWRELRELALARDGRRCTVSRLLGGSCSDVLHVHHVEPVEDRPDLALSLDNLGTACAAHHKTWEAVRRAVIRARGRTYRSCPHEHRTREGRLACERRLNRA